MQVLGLFTRVRYEVRLVILHPLPKGLLSLRFACCVNEHSMSRFVRWWTIGNLDRLFIPAIFSDMILGNFQWEVGGTRRGSQDEALHGGHFCGRLKDVYSRVDGRFNDLCGIWIETDVACDMNDSSNT